MPFKKMEVGVYVSLSFIYQEIITLGMTDFYMLTVSCGCKDTILWEELLGKLIVEIIFQIFPYIIGSMFLYGSCVLSLMRSLKTSDFLDNYIDFVLRI